MKFYNTKTRQVDTFTPQNDGNVLLYTCGPTVYNNLHVGNWVAYIRWDILVRTLLASGYKVTRVMNITDVGHLVSDGDDGEDKMEKGAKREGKTAWQIAQLYTDGFLSGMKQLDLIEPTYITKATDYIPQQIALVHKLEQKGFAYVIDDGVYFDTSKFPSYADFAHLDLDELKEGARVEFNPQKRGAADFALWKFSPKGEQRDMEWDTPWGKGFPGWHLECSAMALDKLGETIDIHTGGIDHIPVHHTNEIAQSEAATGKTFSNYWLHNNFLLVDGTKVSKSIGNTYELSDLQAKGFSANDFRMFVLQSHYRTESNFTWDNLQAAKNRLANWRTIAALEWQHVDTDPVGDVFVQARQRILAALQNDLDTPAALVAVEDAFKHAENGVAAQDSPSFIALIEAIEDMLGIHVRVDDLLEDGLEDLLADRLQARINKDWAKSDELRDELAKRGIIVRDGPTGQTWSRV